MKNIIFRVDADNGKNAGTGHFTRILKIQKYFQSRKKIYNYIILHKQLNKSKEIFKNFKNKIIFKKNFESKLKFVNTNDFLIVDTPYGIDHSLKNFCEKKNLKKVLLIDDINKPKMKNCIIFNGIKYFKKKLINKRNIFQGEKYILLDKQYSIKLKKKPKFQVLISSGGTDNKNILFKICKFIIKNFNLKILVILGSQIKKGNPILTFKHKNVFLINKPNSLYKYFNNCKISIVTGGITMFESLATKKPTLVYESFSHQKFSISYCIKKKFVDKIGENKKLFKKKLYKLIKVYLKTDKLKNNDIDGKGFGRLQLILKKYLND